MPDRLQSDRARRLLDLLGLTEDELCAILDVDPLTLLSGQLDHRPELPILLDLLGEGEERAGVAVLRRWVRATGPDGRPICCPGGTSVRLRTRWRRSPTAGSSCAAAATTRPAAEGGRVPSLPSP